MLISVHKLTKSFGVRGLFKDLTFTIEEGDRIGLIGPNGAGKSTLLKILSGEMAANSGDISTQQGLKIGLLEQAPRFAEGATIFSSILEGTHHPDDWESQSLAREYISRLGLTDFDENAPVAILSGGWKKRVALARELVKKPDLLFLDEPTNHMDMEGIAWLESFLSRSTFAVLTITHDRLFLQRVSNRIIELDPRHDGGLLSVRGDYLKYLEVREQLILAQENREMVLRNTLRIETEWLRRGPKARGTKQQARITAAGELKQEVAELKERNQNRNARMDFVSSERNPKRLIEAKKISKKYGDKIIFTDLSLTLSPGSRIGILGQNGVGKSTLIRTLIGTEEPTSGTVFRSDQLSVAYFDQAREILNPDLTLVETLCPKGDHVEYNGKFVHVRSYLDRFLFSSLQMNMKVGTLSGGEQSRVLVARMMLRPANVLVLDEPTNDLDIATLNVLEQCLKDFNGALILVTHDRYFLDQVANQLLAFPPPGSADPNLVSFASFSQWEEWRPAKQVAAKVVAAPTQTAKKVVKLSFKEQRELDSMEETIGKAEEKLKGLAYETSLSENLSNAAVLTDLSKQMAEVHAQLEKLYEHWAELESKTKI
jgi:ABC transport system ATP-binding/permease protein